MSNATLDSGVIAPRSPQWSAVFSLSLTVVGLVTAELLPISLLTPMASSLGVTEGLTGQAISTTAIVACSPVCSWRQRRAGMIANL